MSYISRYLSYTQHHEAPEIFHKWSAIATIAATLNRKCYLVRASSKSHLTYVSYPGQLLIVLVAGSGRMRKSTTVGFAEKLLLEADSAYIYDGKISPERLLAKLGDLANGAIITIIADELSYFLSKAQYAENMVQNILELSSAKDVGSYETQKKTKILRNACLTGLFATTPKSLGESIPETAHEDGFLSRFIWVFADKPRTIDSMFASEDEIDINAIEGSAILKKQLVEQLQEMAKLNGKFIASNEARKWYNAWYYTYSEGLNGDGDGWPSRVHEHLVRTAMTIAVSERMQLQIEKSDLEEAYSMLTQVSEHLPKVFAMIGSHNSVNLQKKIIALFTHTTTELTTKDIIRKVFQYFKDIRELNATLDTLEQAGILEVMSINASEATKTWMMARDV